MPRDSILPGPGAIVVIGVGIVGCNYGRTVLVPAFRTDARCEVVALAGSDAGRAAEVARAANVARGLGDWRMLVDDRAVDAVAIAVPPDLQPEVARRALGLGKPVFVEKPLAADLAGAQAMLAAARESAKPTMIDFNFPELASWRRAKALLDGGEIGALRHVVVTWNVENPATRLRLKSWKTSGDGGGGILSNFVSHCFHNLEWFCGSIAGLSARIFPLPDGSAESSVSLGFALDSGAGGSLQMSCASFLGSGHRLEFYGDDALQAIAVDDFDEKVVSDPRIAPVARLVRRFIDACETGGTPSPGFVEGYRVQCLIDAARRSHAGGRWIDAATIGEGGQEEGSP
jgi:predicted dehydrogenase